MIIRSSLIDKGIQSMSHYAYETRDNLNAIKNIEDCLWDIIFGRTIDLYVFPLVNDKNQQLGVVELHNFKKETSNFEFVLSGVLKCQNSQRTKTFWQEDFEMLMPDINIDAINLHKYAVQIYYKIRKDIEENIGSDNEWC